MQLQVRDGVRDVPAGVFSLRTPPRLNPIAAQEVDILAVRDGEMDIVGLDCLDGTPLLDIKRTKGLWSASIINQHNLCKRLHRLCGTCKTTSVNWRLRG